MRAQTQDLTNERKNRNAVVFDADLSCAFAIRRLGFPPVCQLAFVGTKKGRVEQPLWLIRMSRAN